MTKAKFVDNVFESSLESEGKELLKIIVEEREKGTASDKEVNEKALEKLVSKLKQK